MECIKTLLKEYKEEGLPHLRLGQYFVCKYVKYAWPELFYEKDNEKAVNTIIVYLQHYHYNKDLPQPTEAWSTQ